MQRTTSTCPSRLRVAFLRPVAPRPSQAIDGPWTAKEPLTLTVTNEYGHFDRRALALYKLDVVIEPYRETKITVMHEDASTSRFQWLLIQSDKDGVPLDGVKPIIEAKGGKFATVTLTDAGQTYALLVKQLGPDGSDVAVGRAKISCKYVRRELRELTENCLLYTSPSPRDS